MPLIVQCPRGCQVKMPRSRSGKIVRCPDCKCAMRVPKLTKAQLALGKTIPVRGKVVHRRKIDPEEAARRKAAEVEAKQAEPLASESKSHPKPVGTPAKEPNPNAFVARSLDLDSQTNPDESIAAPDLLNGDEIKSKKQTQKRRKKEKKRREKNEARQSGDRDSDRAVKPQDIQHAPTDDAFATELPPVTESPVGKTPVAESSVPAGISETPAVEPSTKEPAVVASTAFESPTLNVDSKDQHDSGDSTALTEFPHLETTQPNRSWSTNHDSEKEDLSTEKGLAAAGIVSPPEPPKPNRRDFGLPTPPAVPASFIDLEAPSSELEEEKNWEERLTKANSDRKILARFFAICLCVVAIVNMVPAIYHWYHWTQLTDSIPLPRWIYIQIFVGALHLVYALFLAQIPDWSALRAVALAMLFVAFIFGVVSTGLLVGGQGNLSGFLGIPYALNRQASIWCVAMLCLATLMAYWGGKESANWQRAEHLLKGILAQSN